MGFYNEMQNLAGSILKQFKQGNIKLVQYVEPEEEGTLDEPAERSEVTYDLDATVSGVSYKYLINNYAVASDLIVVAAVIPVVTVTIDDFIEIECVRYKIIRDVSAAPTSASGKPVVWRFICRKG